MDYNGVFALFMKSFHVSTFPSIGLEPNIFAGLALESQVWLSRILFVCTFMRSQLGFATGGEWTFLATKGKHWVFCLGV